MSTSPTTAPVPFILSFHGPKCWILTLLFGLGLGALLSSVSVAPVAIPAPGLGQPDVSGYWGIPFVLLLLCIATVPFIHGKFWEHHFPDVSLFLGGIVLGYYMVGLKTYTVDGHPYGPFRMAEVGLDYFKFMALVGSLFIVSGGIHIDVDGRSTPLKNTLLLTVAAVLANIFGTTGASALMIRPFLRYNKHRVKPYHVMLFIFIVSNTAGCLTPIGDPPLFLGYLQGVEFTWTMVHCLPPMLVCVGLLLIVFYVMDSRDYAAHHTEQESIPAEEARTKVAVTGKQNFVFLGLVILGVCLDPLLHHQFGLKTEIPFGALLQITVAILAYKFSRAEDLKANEFSFNPIREVGLIFAGIFTTMVPALDFLSNNAEKLGFKTPTAFYWGSGALSSFLDNAPTYLNFFSAAHGLATPPLQVGPEAAKTPTWLALETVGKTGYSPAQMLLAISLGSVFFGACSYIGNGPNFMVKAIADTSGVKTPSFFGYIIRYTIPILIPIFTLIWLIFVR